MGVLKKKNIQGFKKLKSVSICKKFHVLIGYAIIAVAITHGVYFYKRESSYFTHIQWYIFSISLNRTRGCWVLFTENE